MIGKNVKLPGEKIALIEEFDAGNGTYEDNGVIRASGIGTVLFDYKKRIVQVEKKNKAQLPKAGDIVVGFIDMVPGNMVSMRILYVNNKKTDSRFTAISLMRGGRGRRGVMFKIGDLVKARVVSLLNANIHVDFRDSNLGVIYTVCHSCGGSVVRVDGRVKCIECGTTEERKLVQDYGKANMVSQGN
ncbi:MAG: exosome complex RNA-binding protein Csl4 [Nitrososphaerales archaeon]